MTESTFDCAFFGYQDLPESIELNDLKLIPIKTLKLKKGYLVNNIRMMCKVLGIPVQRPVKGLYCLEEKYCKFIEHAYRLLREGVWKDWLGYTDLIPVYNDYFAFEND
jgi:hypothetical protein